MTTFGELLRFCKKASRLNKKYYSDMEAFKKAKKVKEVSRKAFIKKYNHMQDDSYIFPGASFNQGIVVQENGMSINWEEIGRREDIFTHLDSLFENTFQF